MFSKDQHQATVRLAVCVACAAVALPAAWYLPSARNADESDPLADQIRAAFLEALALNRTLAPTMEAAGTAVSGAAADELALHGPPLPFTSTVSWPDHGWGRYGMNMTLSDGLPLRRAVPDTRDPGCRLRRYPGSLPAASVIIVFHNEGLSSLLRTVQSVLDRSPPHLLHEVLLVDDFSHFADLGEPLESAVAPLRRVRLLRSDRREGLIRSKSLGALAAGGEALLFLDAHCEVNTGWLPPLLAAVARDRRTVAVPLLDSIDSRSFQYRPLYGATVGPQGSPLLPRGIFDWALRYKERILTPAELQSGAAAGAPYSSATHSGGIFAISRWWFFYLGAYDPQLLGWGAENMELSFKVWMCGGAVQTVPCSRVGHVYRDQTPYGFGDLPARADGPIISANFLRVAHVWMDEHREHFLTEEPASRQIPIGDVSDRQLLRRQLACRSFDWYLATVAPELTAIYPPPPGNAFWGQVVHEASSLCVATGGPVEPLVQTLVLRQCPPTGPDQVFRLSLAGRLISGETCAGFMPSLDSVVASVCPREAAVMTWTYDEATGVLKHTLLGLCLTAGDVTPSQVAPLSGRLALAPCRDGPQQRFRWRRSAGGDSWASRALKMLAPPLTAWWRALDNIFSLEL